MRVLYVANHDQPNSNDDEGAISHALTKLGHYVTRIPELKGYKACKLKADFVLFHKWKDVVALRELKIPRVCWYFDLVDFPDPTLERRNLGRRDWMAHILPHTDIMFCTDGNWVLEDCTGKMIWMTQGADERVRPSQRGRGSRSCNILFTGISALGGQGRLSFVNEMKERYGEEFYHIPSGVYREELAKEISSAAIVVAPDSPITGLYWSNRVYNVLGLRGFLLHPDCSGIRRQYTDGEHLVLYKDREHLHSLIQYYLDQPLERDRIAEAGYKQTLSYHTYTNRIQQLVRVVKEKIDGRANS